MRAVLKEARTWGVQYVRTLRTCQVQHVPCNTAPMRAAAQWRRVSTACHLAAGSPQEERTPGARHPITLQHNLEEGLLEMGIHSLSSIQKRVIPSVLKGGDVVFGSRTGTGKTLAFLLPVIQAMKDDELSHQIATRTRRPRVLVLAPSRELAEQILSVTKALSHHARFRAVGIIGGGKRGKQTKALDSHVDVVVATPGRVLAHRDQGSLLLSDVRYVIIDEADTMLSHRAGFLKETESVVDALRKSAEHTRLDRPVQFIMAAATPDQGVLKEIKRIFPGADLVFDKGTFKLPDGLQQRFVHVGGGHTAKHGALMEALGSRMGRTLVFCNTIQSCRSTEHFLAEHGVATSCLHGDMPPKIRVAEYSKFIRDEANVLVCTDAAARGLDFSQIDHVILFDFPLNSTEYLHRVGRTARAGKPGVATSLVVKRDRVLARAMEDAALRGSGFEALSSDKRAYVPGAQKGRHGGSSKKPARVFREERGPRRKGKSGGAGARAGGGGGKSTAPPVQFEWSNSRAPSSSPATSATRRRSDRQRAGQSGREHTGSATPAGAGAANSRTVKRRGDSMVVNRVKRK